MVFWLAVFPSCSPQFHRNTATLAGYSIPRYSDIKSDMAATQCAELNDLRSLPGDFSLELFNSKSLTIRSKERGYNYFIVKPERVDSNRRVYISARSYRSVRKSETPHRLNMEVSTADHNITDSSCSCVVGYVSYLISHVLFISFIAHCLVFTTIITISVMEYLN